MNRQRLSIAVLTALLLLQVNASIAGQQLIDDLARRGNPISVVAFGSCAYQTRPQPIWDKILETKPDLFLFIGDNVYADTEDMKVMRDKYAMLGAMPGYRKLVRSTPIMATWDDHDYGVNDGGAEYRKRAESREIFFEFFGEPQGSERRKHEGVYDAKIFGPAGKRVQIILLDTRYFRTQLKKRVPADRTRGPYIPDTDPHSTMLGEEQWRWLEVQLKIPAEIRIIASSIQVVAEDHGWEKWMNFPNERLRLFQLIRNTKAAGIIFVSGDRHLAELSMMDGGVGYPLYDLTASGLNSASQKWRPYEVNRHRVGTMNWGDNFGMITIDWNRSDPQISLQIRDVAGDINIQRKINLSTLQPG